MRVLRFLTSTLLLGLLSTYSGVAQDSGGFEIHATPKADAKQIGLPAYPGATPYKDPKSDSKFDFGFTFGETHFKVLAVDYVSQDSSRNILDFYRKPLSKYGEVLECDHGKPVGSLTQTSSGLSCTGEKGDHVQIGGEDSAKNHELRAGSAQNFRIVSVDESRSAPTHFTLVYLELPKDEKTK